MYFNCTISISISFYSDYFSSGDTSRNATLKSTSTGACSFPPYFSCLFFNFFFIFLFIAVFFHIICSFMEINADLVCVRAQAAILWSSGHSVKDIAKLLKKTER